MNQNSIQHTQQPHPPAFHQAIREARRLGLWVKAARLSIPGERRYVVTVANGAAPLFASDDIDEVRAWLREGG